MKHWRAILLWGGLILALAVVNRGIVQRERILDEGRVVLLELAPVDPRSLMQGDYMALRFAVAEDIRNTLYPPSKDTGNAAALSRMGMFGRNRDRVNADGYAVFALDQDGVGRFVRLQTASTPLHAGEVAARHRQQCMVFCGRPRPTLRRCALRRIPRRRRRHRLARRLTRCAAQAALTHAFHLKYSA
jgi:uncharacterized membrane-anchored protein